MPYIPKLYSYCVYLLNTVHETLYGETLYAKLYRSKNSVRQTLYAKLYTMPNTVRETLYSPKFYTTEFRTSQTLNVQSLDAQMGRTPTSATGPG